MRVLLAGIEASEGDLAGECRLVTLCCREDDD